MPKYKPSQADLEWTQDRLSQLRDGGVWAIPSSAAVVRVNHAEKTYQVKQFITDAKSIRNMNRVRANLTALGYTEDTQN